MSTMQFISPHEMAAHLRELVDDDDFIERAVKGVFPEYRREVRERAKAIRRLTEAEARMSIKESKGSYAQRNYVKPVSRQDGFCFSDLRDRLHRNGMEDGSRTLLQKIHKEHPTIMAHLSRHGSGRVEWP